MQELGIAALVFALLVLDRPSIGRRTVGVALQFFALFLIYTASVVGAVAGWGGSVFACLAVYIALSLTGVLDLIHEPYP